MTLTCFKSYDVRGQLGPELNEEICERIGRAFARVMLPETIVTGRDIRDSSARLQAALHRGLMAEGVRVFDIGLCGTEEVYFATDHYGAGGGLMVTASHNPIDYNGIKMVREGARPISAETGLAPNGIPNPLLPENRAATAEAVKATGADLGIAWDGDFDRCFFFDETGAFLDGEYVVALLAAAFCAKEPGARIVYDPRVVFATRAAVRDAGGRPILSKVGHSYIKAEMRKHDAAYGGEMSAHHYFRDFMYCDSGMIPWLLVAEMVARSDQTLGQMVAAMREKYPSSGEINFKVTDTAAAIDAVTRAYELKTVILDRLDGVSFEMEGWRMSVRASNTEPVLRLNVETTHDRAFLEAKVAEVSALLAQF